MKNLTLKLKGGNKEKPELSIIGNWKDNRPYLWAGGEGEFLGTSEGKRLVNFLQGALERLTGKEVVLR